MLEAQFFEESLAPVVEGASGVRAACLFGEALLDHETNRSLMDSMLVDFATKLAASENDESVLDLAHLECSPEVVAFRLLPSLLPLYSATDNHGFESLQDAIDFSTDLGMFARSNPPAPAPVRQQQTVEPAAQRGDDRSNASFRPQTQQPPQQQQPQHVPQQQPPQQQQKQGPFVSAKDQFIQEGGRLPPPAPRAAGQPGVNTAALQLTRAALGGGGGSGGTGKTGEPVPLPEELAHLERALVDKIEHEIIYRGRMTSFDEIAGLSFAKKCVNEIICWPITAPHLFQGLRKLPRGCLLFGPPGTGKTLIGKAIASEAKATFFCISASSLMSKWIGEGEKTVRALFDVAAYRQPSVIFLDEVDSLLCMRSSEENEGSRRMKTEFLVQLDGAGTRENTQVVVIGATNRPEELDEAARRRFVKRIYIPLPDEAGRAQQFKVLLRQSRHELTEEDYSWLVATSAGFSGADICNLCQEAAMGPMRQAAVARGGNLSNINERDISPLGTGHFVDAFQRVTASVSPGELDRYIKWNSEFGSYKFAME